MAPAPLLYLAPDADYPGGPAMPADLDTRQALALGQALKPLRAMNVLIVASGNLTHNLYEFRRHPATTLTTSRRSRPGPPKPCRRAAPLLDYKQHAHPPNGRTRRTSTSCRCSSPRRGRRT
jgi:4,5-DOPA dioxygenase extradiol